MTDSKDQGYGEEMEPEPATKDTSLGATGAGDATLRADDLDEVDQTGGDLTFRDNGTQVDVTVAVPDNDPALESLSVYGSSTDSNPSSDPANELASSATRPANGQLGRTGNATTNGATYTVQLKFWYAGQDKRTAPATILTGSGSTSGSITLS